MHILFNRINNNKVNNLNGYKNDKSSFNKKTNKFIKQVSLISVFVLLSVFFYSSRTRHPVEIIPVMAVPVTNKVVILDAGHGTPDERSRK